MKPELLHFLLLSKRIRHSLPAFLFFIAQGFLIPKNSYAQIDSLRSLIRTTRQDTTRINAMNELAWQLNESSSDSAIAAGTRSLILAEKIKWTPGIITAIHFLGTFYESAGNYPRALEFNFRALALRRKNGDERGIAKSQTNIAIVFKDKGDYDQALSYFTKSLNYYEKTDDKIGIARQDGNLALIYQVQSNYPKAIGCYLNALKMYEALGDKESIARQISNIGTSYMDQGDYNKALEELLRALKMKEDIGNTAEIALTMGNIGTAYQNKGQLILALSYYQNTLTLDETTGRKNRIAITLGNIASTYKDLGDSCNKKGATRHADDYFSKADDTFMKALKLREELGSKKLIATALGNIGLLKLSTKQYDEAEHYLLRAQSLFNELHSPEFLKECEKSLSDLYAAKGDPEKALGFYKKFITIRDSLSSDANIKKQTQTEMNYEFEKKVAAAKAEQNKKDAIVKKERQRQNIIIGSISSGLFLTLLLVVFIFRSYRQKRKANLEIMLQKQIIEEKQKDILASIHYAKRIQRSLLPTEKYIEKSLKRMLVLLIITLPFSSAGQGNKDPDSVRLKTAGEYTKKAALAEDTANYDVALQYHFKALKISEDLGNKAKIAESYSNIGNVYAEKGDFKEALKFHLPALKIRESGSDKKGLAGTYNNIGIVYMQQGNYPEALKYYFSALKLNEELNSKKGIANCYGNIGSTYSYMGNYEEGLKNALSSLKIRKEIGDKMGAEIDMNNLGAIYSHLKNNKKALENYEAALTLSREIDDKQGIAYACSNIGTISGILGNYEMALKAQFEALKIAEEISDDNSIATAYINIGFVYLKQKKTSDARIFLKKGLGISKADGIKDYMKECYYDLSQIDSMEGKFEDAFKNYKLSILYKDSLNNEENTRKAVQTQLQYEFDKKESITKADQDKKDALAKEEKQKQQVIIYSVTGGLFMVLLLAGFVFRSYRQKQRINIQITRQKEIIEEKQKEILDSIRYAKRIQQALLPTSKYLEKILVRHIKKN